MAWNVVVVVLTLHLVQAKIQPTLYIDSKYTANWFGFNDNLISDAERSEFHLSDDEIKRYVNTKVGAWPTDVYIRTPTPWSDLYATYDWEQVKRQISISKIEILHKNMTEVELTSRECENRPHHIIVCEYDSMNIINSVTHTRQSPESWNLDEEIHYKIQFNPLGFSNNLLKMIYEVESWKDKTYIQTFDVERNSVKMRRVLKSGQKAIVKLLADYYTASWKIQYKAVVYGDIAVNFEKTHDDHHFWRYDLQTIMKAANQPVEVFFEETLYLEFLRPSKMQIYIEDSGVVLREVSLALAEPPKYKN